MKNTRIVFGGFVVIAAAVLFWSKFPLKQNEPTDVSPCTGAVQVEPTTPCVIVTGEIPEPGHGFLFRYPENSETTQSSLNVTTIEHGFFSDDAEPSYKDPFYLITFYYNENVSLDAFHAMFAVSEPDNLAGKLVVKSSEAKFPNAEYPFATAYYLDNNGKDAIAIIAGYDSDMLKQAEVIFEEGFRWEE
ncbi:MAG: hypothetical protein UY72_C0072G0001 [Candidatus Uhrbacteria bacterium GW2011_GWD2_52_7]|uniref:Uncharacterized protein n=1 Tax=Candidatus Uhrbacteria bacterium GW2011_GWD2_52_7 TaxID=1618989 RepID=A0A0G1XBV2_9BACT|nr:MAG: hypothetical protein UY72_C0072G0001 [Candidatus Uhrbacteria bacterium GW2011_GWD2_52_7]